MNNNICYFYEDSECTDLVLKGYVFRSNFKKVGEFLYYKNENSLEIYDIDEECTKFYINTSIDEISEVLKDVFYWGV